VKSSRQEEILENLAAKYLHAAVHIVQAHPAKKPRKGVEKPGGQDLEDVVLSAATPADHEVVALVELRHQAGKLSGIILEISIKRRYETPAGTPEAGSEGFGLSMVAVKGDQAKKGIFSKQLQEYIPGGVPAAVIDKNDLTFAPTGISKALVDLPHRLTFIEDGYDDAELEADVAGRCRGVVLFNRWSVPAVAGLKP
jgi:hypothetical protein